ncbi:hypothetical protein ACRAWD_19265 [Caulobacter segnis]
MVGLLAHLPAPFYHHHPARAGQRPVRRRHRQPARRADLAGRHLAAGAGHQGKRHGQFDPGRHQDHRPDGLYRAGRAGHAHENFHPFAPLATAGIIGAGASIFFAYVGFDADLDPPPRRRGTRRSTSSIGLIGSLIICTIFYLLVAAGAIGSVRRPQPVFGAAHEILQPGSIELTARCKEISAAGQMPLGLLA